MSESRPVLTVVSTTLPRTAGMKPATIMPGVMLPGVTE